MFLRTVELAFVRFQARGEPAALAVVFDRTAPELLRVARHLARPGLDAEDLVQSTFLRAIESAADHERGKPVLPWLLGILANQARSSRRALRRAVDPTRLRREAVADVGADVAERELGEALHAAIAAMPEAYRPVLRLWFEHGLEAQEIAATLERPAGTVRAQIARGLEMLRRALPQGLAGGVGAAVLAGRGLASVRSAVLAACPGTSVTVGSALALGGLIVLHHKLIASGAALVLGLLCWSLFSGSPPVEPAVAGTVASANEAATAAVERRDDAAHAPRTDAAAATPRDDSTGATAAEAATTGELVVRLVSARDRTPLAGIGVAVQRLDDLPGFSKLSAYAPSDAAGVVRFPRLLPASWLIDLDRMGSLAAGEVKAGSVTERVVEVPDGITVDGTVVDDRGQPVAGADIHVHGSRLCSPAVATTDALGRFRAAHLVAKVELQARKAGRQPSLAHLVAGAMGSSVAMTLQMGSAGRRVLGRALDASGMPIARGAVAVLPESARTLSPWDQTGPQPRSLWLHTGDDGRFATDECGIGRYLVLVQPLSDETTPCWAFADTQAGDAVVELRAAAPIIVEGRIACEDTPGDGITVSAFPRSVGEIGFLLNLMGGRSAQTVRDGTFRLTGLIAGEVELTARRGFETVAQTVLTLQPGQTARWDHTGAASKPLRIRVTSAAPLPPQLVLMVGPSVPDNSAPSLLPIAGGEAKFTGMRKGDVNVTAVMMFDGAQLVMLARLSAVPPGSTDVELALLPEQMPARSLRGRLVDAMGAPIRNATLTAARFDQPGMFSRRTAVTGDDGTFAIGPLPAGSWVIQLGELPNVRAIGHAMLTADRDFDLGDLKEGGK